VASLSKVPNLNIDHAVINAGVLRYPNVSGFLHKLTGMAITYFHEANTERARGQRSCKFRFLFQFFDVLLLYMAKELKNS